MRASAGRVRAILFAYACHNTTLTAEFYQLSGDYAGFAAAALEAAKETDKVQAERMEKIQVLSAETHLAVNSQRDRLEAKFDSQEVAFKGQIAELQTQVQGMAALHTELLVQREKDKAEAGLKLLEAQLAPAVVLTPPAPAPDPAPPLIIHPEGSL